MGATIDENGTIWLDENACSFLDVVAEVAAENAAREAAEEAAA